MVDGQELVYEVELACEVELQDKPFSSFDSKPLPVSTHKPLGTINEPMTDINRAQIKHIMCSLLYCSKC